MALQQQAEYRDAAGRAAVETLLLLTVLAVALVSGLFVLKFGLYALVLPAYTALVLLIVVDPNKGALAVLAIATILEPGIQDWTTPFDKLFYSLPPKWDAMLPLQVAPFEMLLILCAAMMLLRRRTSGPHEPLPLIMWAVPAAVGAGLFWGMARGGDASIAYHEMRGILYSLAVFLIALRMSGRVAPAAIIVVLASTAVLALIALDRYFTQIATGQVTSEVAFAHETPVFLTVGIVVAACLAVRSESGWRRMLLSFLMLLLLAALVATSRRAGTLVLITGMGTVGAMTWRHRPLLMTWVGIITLICFAAYLAAYWNQEYGALAQPARAIRSQIDPSARDESSDTYRETERYNITQTLRVTPVFGVGFGRPFAQYQPLPDLTAFWPLQSYVPHENVMWLWLKLGIGGISAVLAFVVIALRKAINTAMRYPLRDPRWMLACVSAATILMYLAFGTVDIAFATTRSLAPMAAALAFALRGAVRKPEVE